MTLHNFTLFFSIQFLGDEDVPEEGEGESEEEGEGEEKATKDEL